MSFFLKLALTRPGRWVLSNFTARLDPIIYRRTGGRLNSTGVILFPALALTTTGRTLRVFRLPIPGIEETCVR